MLTFTIAARFREHSGNRNGATASERTHFYPYVNESTTLPDGYIAPFFVINRPPSKGSPNLGKYFYFQDQIIFVSDSNVACRS